jgi:hypothetical protein
MKNLVKLTYQSALKSGSNIDTNGSIAFCTSIHSTLSVCRRAMVELCIYFIFHYAKFCRSGLEMRRKEGKSAVAVSRPKSELRYLQVHVAHIHTMCFVQNILNQVYWIHVSTSFIKNKII